MHALEAQLAPIERAPLARRSDPRSTAARDGCLRSRTSRRRARSRSARPRRRPARGSARSAAATGCRRAAPGRRCAATPTSRASRAVAMLSEFSIAWRTVTIPCELLVVVLRPPRPARRRDLERRVVEQVRERDRGRAAVGLERRGVDERLEGAAGLTARLRAAIELRGGVVASPHQREQLAGLRPQRDQAALQRARGLLGAQARVALLEIGEALAQRDRRQPLRAAVERRVDAQPVGLEHARVIDVGELAAQQVEEIPGVARIGRHRRRAAAARPAPWRAPPASSRPCSSIISSTRLRRRIARSGSR